MSRPSNEVINKSRKKIYKRQQIQFHREYDKDCIDKLESVPSKPAYIKQLIRDDIKREEEQK